MKKWYVITGILALFGIISLGTCSGQSSRVSELEVELFDVKGRLAELEDAEVELERVRADLAQLKATKEIVFDKGLRVFEVSLPTGYFGSASGKVQNVSSESMELVYIAVVAYGEDGSLEEVSLGRVYDLFPDEVADWVAYPGPAASYGLYAFGNR
ncbi:hypothetical protein ES703_102317 [subsurface metagenome]